MSRQLTQQTSSVQTLAMGLVIMPGFGYGYSQAVIPLHSQLQHVVIVQGPSKANCPTAFLQGNRFSLCLFVSCHSLCFQSLRIGLCLP